MSRDVITTRHVSGHIAFQGTAEDHARWSTLQEALRSAAKSVVERCKPSGQDG